MSTAGAGALVTADGRRLAYRRMGTGTQLSPASWRADGPGDLKRP